MFWGWSGCACAGETLVRRGISLDETVSCLYRDGLDMFGAWLVFFLAKEGTRVWVGKLRV